MINCKPKVNLLVTAYFVASTFLVHGQRISESTIRKIDTLFAESNHSNTPGFMVAIVRNDSLMFSKGYGMANLEYGIPITENTVFYVASVSKQFTGYCVTLLARQKKIDLSEDIRVYLPWFPDLKKKITIRNLLNHTSGIRDHLNMIAITGLGIDGVLTNEQVLKVLQKQRDLNFEPGERYSYSNSNYILLAEVIKEVTGQSLRQFADSAIFKPLQMTRTHFHDNPSELVENRAVSYWQEHDMYSNAFQNIYTVGDGGMMTTVGDAARWVMNLYSPKVGDSKDVEALTKTGHLTNGKKLSYASGISVGEHNGWKVYSHAGGLHGYSAIISVFPDLRTGFIIFGNIRKGDMQRKVIELASLVIEPKPQSQKSTSDQLPAQKAFFPDSTFLKNYAGQYISDEGYLLRLTWRDKKLLGSGFGQEFEITGKEKTNTFFFPSKNNPLTKIVFEQGSKSPEFNLEFPDEILRFSKFDSSISVNPKDLVGEYYSRELDCTYHIILKEGELFLTNNKYPDSKLILNGIHLTRSSWYMNHMTITKDKNAVTGFHVNSGGVMKLPFVKVK